MSSSFGVVKCTYRRWWTRRWWTALCRGPPRAGERWGAEGPFSGAPAGLLAADALAGDALLVPRAGVGRVRVGGQAPGLAQLRQQRADVGAVGIGEDAVGAEHVTRGLGRLQRLPVDQQRLRRRLLDVHHRADLAGDLGLDVVALVQHEVD